MKKYLAFIGLILAIPMLLWAGDLRIEYTEKMVGAGHPTLPDTLNRLTLGHHNTDGSHIDNDISGVKLIDNTVLNSKLIDNTIDLGKIKHSGTASSSTFLRGDGEWTTTLPQIAAYKNLRITTPAANQNVTITADKVVVTTTEDVPRVLSSVSLTVALNTSGANGLDNGFLAANTGYFLYVIDNGATTAGLASTSATIPTMPNGYTYKALVGWCTTDNTASPFNIQKFTQIDDVYHWSSAQLVYMGTLSTSTLAINLAASGILGYQSVPAVIAKEAIVRVQSTSGAYLINPVTFPNMIGEDTPLIWSITYLAGGTPGHGQVRVPLVEAQTLYHQHTQTQATKTYIVGFILKR